jgi:hypothetical protein
MTKERSVTAIVLNHEKADEESCGRHSEEQANPIPAIESSPHQKPDQNEGYP